MNTKKYSVQCGMFDYDGETKKVKLNKNKGRLTLSRVSLIEYRMKKDRII